VARIHVLEKQKCVQCFDGVTGEGGSNSLEVLHVVGMMILKLFLKK